MYTVHVGVVLIMFILFYCLVIQVVHVMLQCTVHVFPIIMCML